MSKTAWVWIIIIILAGVVIWGIASRNGEETETPITPQPSIENRVEVNDQPTGSLNVAVASAYLQTPGFIVIHEQESGAVGKIVAASSYLPAGAQTNVTIVTSALVDGKTYIAMLHQDNGDQKFDASQDAPMTDEDGNAAMDEFRVSGNVLGLDKG